MDLMQRRRLLMMDSSKAYTVTGNPVSFETNLAKPLKGMVIPFSPVQEGTGDPSPSNVRSISGWDGLTAYRTGANLMNPTVYNYANASVDGVNQVVAGDSYRGIYTPLKAGTYTISRNIVSGNRFRLYATVDKPAAGVPTTTIREYRDTDLSLTFTFPEGHNWFFVYLANDSSTITSNIMLNPGSTALPYTPFSGSTYPVAFPSDPGTIYGGYVDLAQGVVVAERMGKTMKWSDGTNETAVSDTVKRRRFTLGYIPKTGTANNICNVCSYGSGVTFANAFYVAAISNVGYGYVNFENDISENTEITIVSALATPISYPLSSVIPTTLKGTNAIWTDTNGQNTVTYLKRG